MSAPKKTSTVPPRQRDPRERFVALANKRVEAAIQQLRLVGNLANRRNYEFNDAEAKKIVRALQSALDDVRVRFKGDENGTKSTFRL
jgi:ABC-type Fe3+-hydroxamate transport system substrate-binding protein